MSYAVQMHVHSCPSSVSLHGCSVLLNAAEAQSVSPRLTAASRIYRGFSYCIWC